MTKRERTAREQWFLDRIGKVVFRDDDGCPCAICKNAVEHGILINDEVHAMYLYEIESDYAMEGISLNYRDEK